MDYIPRIHGKHKKRRVWKGLSVLRINDFVISYQIYDLWAIISTHQMPFSKMLIIILFCHGLNVCVLPNSYVETLVPYVKVLEGRAFGWYLGQEDEALIKGINILIKETLQRSLVPSIMWEYREKALDVNQEEGSHQNATLLIPRSWISQSLQQWKINFCHL